MHTEKKNGTYVQCRFCGTVHQLEYKVPSDVLIVKAECPICKRNSQLNCGDSVDDIYLYMDNVLDERYYQY